MPEYGHAACSSIRHSAAAAFKFELTPKGRECRTRKVLHSEGARQTFVSIMASGKY